MKRVRLKCGKAFPTTYAPLIQTVNVDKCSNELVQYTADKIY